MVESGHSFVLDGQLIFVLHPIAHPFAARQRRSRRAIFGIMRGKKMFGGVLVQAGALLINPIAPRRRTLTPSA